jgi:hypothetical protein
VERLNIAINFAYEKFFLKRDENDEGKGLCVLMFTQFNDFWERQSGRKSK